MHSERQPSVLDAIGDTQLVNIDGIWAKLELHNPSGSIKDRLAVFMIEDAERRGLVQPGDTIVEASSGNTGNAIAMVAAAKGYRAKIVMPRFLSRERAQIARAFGAEIHLVGEFHVNAALEESRRLGELPRHFRLGQFDNELNIEENERWLGAEIITQLPAGVVPDTFVAGVGTGGTVLGVGRALRSLNAALTTVALEPTESLTLCCGEVGRHRIEGIADGFVPELVARHRNEIDQLIAVSGEEALSATAEIARRTGIFAGPSSGANYAAARRLSAQQPDAHVVTVFPDAGWKYLSLRDAMPSRDTCAESTTS